MAPILGIYASSITPSKQLAYESISTVTVGAGGAASVTLSSIPSTYQHLQIRYIGRLDQGSVGQLIRFNSDSGTNYAFHSLQGTGTAVSPTFAGSNTATPTIGYVAPNIAASGIMGGGFIDILDYANTNKYKTAKSLSGVDYNSAGITGIYSTLWMNTSAITSITFLPQGGANYVQHSSFALYGIKG